MGIQAMIATLKANKRSKRVIFDKSRTSKNQFGEFVDHTKMNTYEYAAFQKKVFKEKKREKQKYYLIVLITVITVICVYFFFPSVVNFMMNKLDQPY